MTPLLTSYSVTKVISSGGSQDNIISSPVSPNLGSLKTLSPVGAGISVVPSGANKGSSIAVEKLVSTTSNFPS